MLPRERVYTYASYVVECERASFVSTPSSQVRQLVESEGAGVLPSPSAALSDSGSASDDASEVGGAGDDEGGDAGSAAGSVHRPRVRFAGRRVRVKQRTHVHHARPVRRGRTGAGTGAWRCKHTHARTLTSPPHTMFDTLCLYTQSLAYVCKTRVFGRY